MRTLKSLRALDAVVESNLSEPNEQDQWRRRLPDVPFWNSSIQPRHQRFESSPASTFIRNVEQLFESHDESFFFFF